MRDLPIPFTAAMMRANLALRKKQTRRSIIQPTIDAVGCRIVSTGDRSTKWEYYDASGRTEPVRLKYATGDRLYTREAWRTYVSLDAVAPRDLLTEARGAGIAFVAGGGLSLTKPPRVYGYDDEREDLQAFGKYRQGMHMPRWASRGTCLVTEVRVERLQQITDADAISEGIDPVFDDRSPGEAFWKDYETYADGTPHAHAIVPYTSPIASYRSLWGEINGPDSWAANPFVAVYGYSFTPKNIDDI